MRSYDVNLRRLLGQLSRAFLMGVAWLCLWGCAPSKTTTVLPPETPIVASDIQVVDVRVEPGDRRMTVEWKKLGEGLFSGYNIYISENATPADTDAPFNLEPYPGDTDPDDGRETFQAENLENGRRYYVTVRPILPDRSLGSRSNQATTMCGPRGEVTIEARYSGEHDGLALETGAYVRANSRQSDLYFYTNEGKNFLASPDRLDGFNKKTKFSKLKLKGSLAEIRTEVGKLKIDPVDERVEVAAGDWILVRTADARNGLLRILDVEGKGKTSRVRLDFVFCPAVGEMVF